MMGLTPHPEFAKKHAYDTFKYFPELRKTQIEIEAIQNDATVGRKGQKHMQRRVSHVSTHKLDGLSKSSYHEVTGLFDFRKTLFQNRKKINKSLELTTRHEIVVDTSKQQLDLDPLTIANDKLSRVSLTFDPLSSNNHLEGFDGLILTKKELQFLMRRCLNISLKPDEMDVLFKSIDADKSGLIDGVEFVRYFVAMGNKARANVQREKQDRILKAEDEVKQKRMRDAERIAKYERQQITEYTTADLESAIKKLSKVALYWIADADASIATQYAMETYFTPYEFKRQIETCFGLQFTPSEMGALVAQYRTRDEEACIDGYLFLKKFVQLQTISRQQNKIVQLANKKKKDAVTAMNQRCDYIPKALGR